jgi:hypothetical protein
MIILYRPPSQKKRPGRGRKDKKTNKDEKFFVKKILSTKTNCPKILFL